MRSGGAYLPLHIEWPWERIRDILQQARCDILLLSAQQCHDLAHELSALPSDITILVFDEIVAPAQERASTEVAWPIVRADDLAYIILPLALPVNRKG